MVHNFNFINKLAIKALLFSHFYNVTIKPIDRTGVLRCFSALQFPIVQTGVLKLSSQLNSLNNVFLSQRLYKSTLKLQLCYGTVSVMVLSYSLVT